MSIDDDERLARATLLRVAEPAQTPLITHVERVGVRQALLDIAAGATIAGCDVDALRQRLTSASGEADLAAAQSVGARLVCPGDDEWPLQLDDLAEVGRQSFGLWALGPLSLAEATNPSVAMVGSRAATDYGAAIAADMAFELAEAGWAVVSGLAYGIDAAAHRGALSAGGVTVGVLACGIDVPYPAGNRALARRMAETGLVVSEHPPGSAPYRARFLVRNRIIAALAAGTVVVEMGLRSGARSTATHAAYLNRHVMCVPGPITSSMSAGCHRLLRENPETLLVTSAAEVVEQCGAMGGLAPQERGPTRAHDVLGRTVSAVFEAVPVHRPAEARRIATAAGVGLSKTDAALRALQAAGLAEYRAEGWVMTAAGRADRHAPTRARNDQLDLDWW